MKCIYIIFSILFIVTLAACNTRENSISNENVNTKATAEELQNKLDSLIATGETIDIKWKFHHGNVSDSLVNLPHSFLLPNTELHYEAILNIKQGYFKISADDGMRLWINNERTYSEGDNYFHISASKSNAYLKIVVLNNAMSGGLKSIKYYPEEEFNKMKNVKQEILNLRGGFPKFEPKELEQTEDVLSFAIWGDSQGGWDTFPKIIKALNTHNIDFSIGLGDLVDNGTDEEEWINFNENLKQLVTPSYLIAGNHEYDGYTDYLLSANFMNYYFGNTKENSYYHFNVGKCAFVTLDPNINFPLSIDKTQYSWLISKLKSDDWKNADWRFLLVHQPPFGQGWAGYHGEDYLTAMLDSLAEEYRIDFVLSGHVHDYERLSKKYGKQQTHFIISGGAGGGLEPIESSEYPVMDKILKQHHYCILKVEKQNVQLNVYDTSNRLIDNKKYSK